MALTGAGGRPALARRAADGQRGSPQPQRRRPRLSAHRPSSGPAAPSGQPRRQPPGWGGGGKNPAGLRCGAGPLRKCHPASGGRPGRGFFFPSNTWTERRERRSSGGRPLPPALPPASGRRRGRRGGARPPGAVAVPPAADLVAVRRGPAPRQRRRRAGRALGGSGEGWGQARRKAVRVLGAKTFLLPLPGGRPSGGRFGFPPLPCGRSNLCLVRRDSSCGVKSGAAMRAACGNPHPAPAVFPFPFKIRVFLSNFDSCFANNVSPRFWLLL